jgi:hypothetical protein
VVAMVIDLHVAKAKEYLVFTLICLFYFSYASTSFVVAKLEIIVAK